MKIGILLLKLRKARRLSQAEVADRVGISQSAYCAWESDRALPSAHFYSPLAALFNVDLRELLPADRPVDHSPEATPPLPTNGQSLVLHEVLIKTQQETIALQRQRIEQLEAENQHLRRLTASG
jgi:transcriptional regulator with XRE-family HTH domain